MSIYSIANWSNASTYNTWDIVRFPSNTNTFYYSLADGNLNITPTTVGSWGGISSFNGISKPSFIWRTNYAAIVQHQPSTLDIVMGEGYSQRISFSPNNDLLKLNVSFELRTEKETAAIVHFFYARQGKESFLFVPSPPHDLQKLFICKVWDDNYIYYNNHSIKCVLEEVPN